MPEDADFFAPRQCLAHPLPEAGLAADLLSEAVDAVVAGDKQRAIDLLAQADMPVLRAFSRKVMDNCDPTIQRYRSVKVPTSAGVRSQQRMRAKADALNIFKRDGFRCRFCGSRVVLPDARKRLRALLPESIPIGDASYHPAFLTLNATLDHVVPHARGGDNSSENLVTTCWPCNFGKEAYLLENLGLIDPRRRPPVVDAWDGLRRLLAADAPLSPLKQKKRAQQPPTPLVAPAQQTPPTWHGTVDKRFPGAVRALLALVKACAPIGLTTAINKECMIRLTVGTKTIIPFAVTRTGDVELPWSIGPHKAVFRPFAERIGASVAGAIAYETPKTWSVRMADNRKLTVADLLKVQPAVISGLIELRDRMAAGA